MAESVVSGQSAAVVRAVDAARSLMGEKEPPDRSAQSAAVERRPSTAPTAHRDVRGVRGHARFGGDPGARRAARDASSAPASPAAVGALERLVDVLDRERLKPVEVLVIARLTASEATVSELARDLDRDVAAIRSAAGDLVGRGLLRHRSAPRGQVLGTTVSGMAALSRLAGPLNHPLG